MFPRTELLQPRFSYLWNEASNTECSGLSTLALNHEWESLHRAPDTVERCVGTSLRGCVPALPLWAPSTATAREEYLSSQCYLSKWGHLPRLTPLFSKPHSALSLDIWVINTHLLSLTSLLGIPGTPSPVAVQTPFLLPSPFPIPADPFWHVPFPNCNTDVHL